MSIGTNESRRMADLMPPLQSVRDILAAEAVRQREISSDPAPFRSQRARALFWSSGLESLVYRFDNALHNLARMADSPVNGRIFDEFVDFQRWISNLAEDGSGPEVMIKVVGQALSDVANLENVSGWSNPSAPPAMNPAADTGRLPPGLMGAGGKS